MSEQTLKPGWKRVKFGDVVRHVKDKVDVESAGLDRYIAGEHMDTDDLRIRRWGTIDDGYLGPAFHMRFKSGQVLYGSRRTYLRKVAVPDFEGICANTTFVLEAKDPTVLLPELLPFIMQTESFNDHSIKQSKGSVNPYVNFSDLAWYEFALPPLEEQRRIVDVLSKLENLWDCYREALLSSRQLLPSLMASSLESIAASSETNSVPIAELRLGKESVLKTGPFGSKLKTDYFKASGIPVISIGSLQEDGLNNSEFFYLDPVLAPEFKEYETQLGDIVFSRVADVGRCHLITETEVGFIISSNLIRIRINQSLIRPTYLWLLLKFSIDIRRQLASMTTQAAGRLLINTQTMDKLKFRVPALAIQDYVIAHYQETREATNALISRLNVSKCLFHSTREQMFEKINNV